MRSILTFLFAVIFFSAFAQIDSAFVLKIKSLDTADVLRMDTAAVPNDLFTQKIQQLRKERHGLNIETIVLLKISEQQAKDTTHPKEFYKKLTDEITSGRTGKLLNNSVVNLYRRNFTEAEVDDLIKFYQTSAGKKMDDNYLIVLVESAKDAEYLLKKAFAEAEKQKK